MRKPLMEAAKERKDAQRRHEDRGRKMKPLIGANQALIGRGERG